MKSRIFLASVTLAVFTVAFGLRAQDAPSKAKPANKGAQIREDLALKEKILAEQFARFQQSLLRLKQTLERSPKQEDRERAMILEKVLDRAKDVSIATQFEQLVDFLKSQKLGSVGEIKSAMDRSAKLAENLRELLDLIRQDTKTSKLRDEANRLKKLIEELDKVITAQKIVQGQTDGGKTDPMELKGNQNNVTKATEKIAKALGNPDGQAKDTKGNAKDGGKAEGKKGEAKDAGKPSESKSGKAKDGGKEGDPKKGEAKGGEQAAKDPKAADAKPGDAKTAGKKGDGKPGDAKGSKSAEGAQGQAKDNKGDDKGKEAVAKDEGKPSSLKEKTKPGEAKAADAKKDDKKGDGQAQAKSGGQKGDAKQGQAKGSKQTPQQAQAKEGEKKDKQGEAKGGSQSQGQGQAKSGGQQQPPSDQKGDPSAQKSDPKQPDQIGKKQVEDANYKQQQAEEKIGKDNKSASQKQGEAIKDLESAKKKLEELLRQIREEELERLLANLQARCEKMLAMQISVLAGTEQVAKALDASADKKGSRDDQQKSLKLSDDEKEIVLEASKAIELLEAEGSAVAFPEVFHQVREDMKHVQRRLGVVDVGVVTQAIEKDIIDTLKEMIDALKKARNDMDQKKAQGKPKDGQKPPNVDQKLLDQIAELKMIRSMQKRVNDRTEIYGKQYQTIEGEQTGNPEIRRELHGLSERQERIFEITSRIAKGDNK